MCLPIDSCFGFGTPRTEDDHYHYNAPASRGHPPAQRNGNGYPAHGHGAAEADRKASNDATRGTAHHHAGAAAVPRGWHGHAATAYPQEKAAGADVKLKQQQHPAAWNARVAADGHGPRGGAPHSSSPYERAAHREQDAAADSHYPAAAATATADHERY